MEYRVYPYDMPVRFYGMVGASNNNPAYCDVTPEEIFMDGDEDQWDAKTPQEQTEYLQEQAYLWAQDQVQSWIGEVQ